MSLLDESKEYFKITLIGGPSVGKTCILNYLEKQKYIESLPTINSNCIKKQFLIDDEEINLEIWDTAGQEKYRSIGPLFFRNSKACIAVYDVLNEKSFNLIIDYINDYLDYVPENKIIIIAANKIDLINDNFPNFLNEGQNYSLKEKYDFFKISALTGEGINEIFIHLSKLLYKINNNNIKFLKNNKKNCC